MVENKLYLTTPNENSGLKSLGNNLMNTMSNPISLPLSSNISVNSLQGGERVIVPFGSPRISAVKTYEQDRVLSLNDEIVLNRVISQE